jgi:hypothetical protein
MKDFAKYCNNRLKTLQQNMENEIWRELEDIGNNTVEKIQKYLDENWYNQYDPKDYERTYKLKNAVKYTIEKNGKRIKIYFDRRTLRGKRVNNGEGWQVHRGFDGEDFIDGLIDFINGDVTGGVVNNPRRNDSVDVIDYAERVVNEYVQQLADRKIQAIVNKYLKK